MLRSIGRKPKKEFNPDEPMSLMRISVQNLVRNSAARPSSSHQLVNVAITNFEGTKFYKSADFNTKSSSNLTSFPKYTLPIPNFLKIRALEVSSEPLYENYEIIEQARKASLAVRVRKNPTQDDLIDLSSSKSCQDEGYISMNHIVRKNSICLMDEPVLSTQIDNEYVENLTIPSNRKGFIFTTNPAFTFDTDDLSYVGNFISPVIKEPILPNNFIPIQALPDKKYLSPETKLTKLNTQCNKQETPLQASIVLKNSKEENQSERNDYVSLNRKRSIYHFEGYLQPNRVKGMIQQGKRGEARRNVNGRELSSFSQQFYARRNENVIFENTSEHLWNSSTRPNNPYFYEEKIELPIVLSKQNGTLQKRGGIWCWVKKKIFRMRD